MTPWTLLLPEGDREKTRVLGDIRQWQTWPIRPYSDCGQCSAKEDCRRSAQLLQVVHAESRGAKSDSLIKRFLQGQATQDRTMTESAVRGADLGVNRMRLTEAQSMKLQALAGSSGRGMRRCIAYLREIEALLSFARIVRVKRAVQAQQSVTASYRKSVSLRTGKADSDERHLCLLFNQT
jgi:hypothetical protein